MVKLINFKTMIKVIYFLIMFYSLSTIAQVGIGIEDPKAAVHIAKGIKFKDLRNVDEAMVDYSQHLIADEKGNLAVFTGLPTSLMFKNVTTKKMENIVYITKEDVTDNSYNQYTEKSLDLATELIIPANKTYVLELTYSIPAIYASSGNPKGEYGVFLKKKLPASEFEKISESVRIFSSSHKTPTLATANGRAISCTYVDTISNNTNKEIIVVYDIYGFTENIYLGNYSINFGAYNVEGNNYNWGKGLFLVTINELIN